MEFGHWVVVNTLLLLLPPYWFAEMGRAQTMCKPDKFFISHPPKFSYIRLYVEVMENLRCTKTNLCCKGVECKIWKQSPILNRALHEFLLQKCTCNFKLCDAGQHFHQPVLYSLRLIFWTDLQTNNHFFFVWGFIDRFVTAMSWVCSQFVLNAPEELTHPQLLEGLKYESKWKTTEEGGVGARSVVHNTWGVEGCVGAPGWD